MHPHQRVSLPSIHEMFPDFLSFSGHPPPLPPPLATQPSRSTKAPPVCRAFSFDVLRSDPTTSSLEHISSSSSLCKRVSGQQISSSAGIANGSAPAFRVTAFAHASSDTKGASAARAGHTRRDFTDNIANNNVAVACTAVLTLATSRPSLCQDIESRAEDNNVSVESAGPDRITIANGHDKQPASQVLKGKRHECSICSKRFNRPSSLRIHVNTHTGATPFRCPHPTCGREFNVNSNMRRHYRNHALPVLTRSSHYIRSSRRQIVRARHKLWRSSGTLTSNVRNYDEAEECEDANSEEDDEDDDEEGMSSMSETESPTSLSFSTSRYPSGVVAPILSRKRSMDGTKGRMTSAACV